MVRRSLIGVTVLALAAGVLPSQAAGTLQRIEARTGGADAVVAAVLYRHQDCIDEAAGVLGVQGHGTHVSAPFTAPAATMTFILDAINVAAATCLATSAAGLPPRNAYVGHYRFVLTDVHPTAVPFDEPRERFRCEYIGVPLPLLGNFTCSGLQTFWGNRDHTITITIDPSITLLGLTVPSVGAAELTVSF